MKIEIERIVYPACEWVYFCEFDSPRKGGLKAVQGDGGWNTPDMVTKRYAHILDEDRRKLATDMEANFYQKKSVEEKSEATNIDEIAALLKSDPSLLIKVVQSIQSANMS